MSRNWLFKVSIIDSASAPEDGEQRYDISVSPGGHPH